MHPVLESLPKSGNRSAVIAANLTVVNEPNPTPPTVTAAVWLTAIGFFLATTSASWMRWGNFQYRTFDLAYYVQALWQLIHGRFEVTVENVPLLGNHVEPIVLLIAPIFAIVRHPMLFVVVQNAALATLAPIGFVFARRYFKPITAAVLSIALLLTPAAAYIALHEFHPEALSAPLLLLMIYSRSVRRLWLHWLCFVGVLSCKENMALLLAAYCGVFLVIERRSERTELIRWFGAPLALAIIWFVLCTKVITPAFNAGNIDYLNLYDRLGTGPADIAWNAVMKPQLIGGTLWHAITHGNLVWALLLPLLALPVLRPRWLLIAAPILLQHLLSWRSSEWTVYFHYAAPLLPLFWVGAVEGLAVLIGLRERPAASAFAGCVPGFSIVFATVVSIACLTAQVWIGPARAIGSEFRHQSEFLADRARKQALIAKIPANASILAPLPYLSHLAMREKLYSLHYIFKGLKTLSRQRYDLPPPTEFVLIDYNDSATFDADAGYYHPQMRTADGRLIPSSDRLLHDFMSRTAWTVDARDNLALFTRTKMNNVEEEESAVGDRSDRPPFMVPGSTLLTINRAERSQGNSREIEMELRWEVHPARQIFPWMVVRLTSADGLQKATVTKGLCAIDVREGIHEERWTMMLPGLPPGSYRVDALFVDNPKRLWAESHGEKNDQPLLGPPVSVGDIAVSDPAR